MPFAQHKITNPRVMQPAPIIEGEAVSEPTHISPITWTFIAFGAILLLAFTWFYINLLCRKKRTFTASPIENKANFSFDDHPLNTQERTRLLSWIHRRPRERFDAQSPDLTPRPLSPPCDTKSYFLAQSRNHHHHHHHFQPAPLPPFQRMSLVPNIKSPPQIFMSTRHMIKSRALLDDEPPAPPPAAPAPAPSRRATQYFTPIAIVTPSLSPIPPIWDPRRAASRPKCPKARVERHKVFFALGRSDSTGSVDLDHTGMGIDTSTYLLGSKVRDSLDLEKGRGQKGQQKGRGSGRPVGLGLGSGNYF